MSALILFILQISIFDGVIAEYHFVKQPSDTEVIEGMSLQFQCEAIITTPFQGQNYAINWQRNGSNFVEVTHSQYGVNENKNSNRYNLSLTSVLKIFNVSLQDEGSYHCNLYPASGSVLIASHNARAVVIPKPTFLQQPRNVSAIEGRITTLRCKIQGVDLSVMSVKWTKDNLDVAILEDNTSSLEEDGRDDRYSIIGGNHDEAYHLQILRVRKSDAGMLYCSVSLTTSGEVILKSNVATIYVLFPPNEKYPSCITAESKSYSAGDTLTIKCISRGGNGPLRLSWLRNGDEINGTRVDTVHPDIRDTLTLTPADNGAILICVMTGTAVQHPRYCMIGPLEVYFEPIVAIEPRMTHVCTDHSVTFKCSASVNPPITFTYSWLLDGENLDNSNSDLTLNWTKIEEHMTSNISEINVTCTADDMNSRVSDTATLRISSLTSVHVATLSPQSSVSLVIHYVGDMIVLLVIIAIVCFIFLRRKKRKMDYTASNLTSLSDIVQKIPRTNRKNNHNNSELQSIKVNERNGNAI